MSREHSDSYNLLEYTVYLNQGREIQVQIPRDSTVAKLTQKVQMIAEQLQLQQFEKIVCLESVSENEVIDYYLT